MSENMEIRSNTKGKIQKILNGTVFGNEYTFLTEFLQNAQRSRAKNISFDIDPDGGCLVVYDDGCGCKNPESVFTLDLSEWESTSEGFGIGFWSCLCVHGLRKVIVSSYDWECAIDIDRLKEGDLKVDRRFTESIKGFDVALYMDNEELERLGENLWEKLSEAAKFMKMNVFSDGRKVERQDVLDTFEQPANCLYYEKFQNSTFDAVIGTTPYSFGTIRFYYEDRFVCEKTESMNITGIVCFHSGKITLKEPDREQIVKDKKYFAFTDKLNGCIHDLYRNAVQLHADDDRISLGASNYLSEKELLKYIDLGVDMDGIDVSVKKELVRIPTEEDEEKRQQEIAAKISNHVVDTSRHEESDQRVEQQFVSRHTEPTKPAYSDNKDKVKELKKKRKWAVYVDKDETEYYKDDIARANYCGITVLEAKNQIYTKIFLSFRIQHISNLSHSLTECYTKQNVSLKTQKEVSFIKWLTPIVEHFHLRDDVFMIADLSQEIQFHNDDGISRITRKNKEGDIQIKAITDHKKIYLDRTMLGLRKQKLNVTGFMGRNEMCAVMKAMPSIAHELAHMLYGTTDNTKEHYAAIEMLMDEIVALY